MYYNSPKLSWGFELVWLVLTLACEQGVAYIRALKERGFTRLLINMVFVLGTTNTFWFSLT
jgi:hypothetical protein